MKKIVLILSQILIVGIVYPQSVAINNSGALANPSAILDVQTNSKGVLIPRMSYTERLAIVNPATGLLVYQTNEVGEFTSGFYYFDGNSWRSLTASTSFNNAGKPTIVITDTISNAAAQLKILQEFGYNTQRIIVTGCVNLTALDLSIARELIDLKIEDNPVLSSVNLINLKAIEGGQGFAISNCPLLTILSCPNLQIATTVPINNDGINFTTTGLTTINLPALRKLSNLSIVSNTNLQRINVPLLNKIESMGIFANPVLDSLRFPALANTSNVNAMSVLVESNTTLTSIQFPVLSAANFNIWRIIGNRLSTNSVNHILNVLVNINPPFTGRTIELQGQIIPAPPSGQGIIDKQTLQARPNSVFTD
jgi:hypothetical protein